MKEESDYLLRVKSHHAQNTEDKFYEKLPRFGTLTLNYNVAAEFTPQHLYEAYKQRNEIKVMFDSYKNFMDADKTFMQNRYVLEGWLSHSILLWGRSLL